ncbi:MAG TPA: hypothetical protein VMS96_06420 [Terriglobales bacterium]|nr:hypothetical protein [Terriglobales bacterium]
MKTAYVPVVPQFGGGPFKSLPFRPLWLSGLSLHDRGVFSALLDLSWGAVPTCYLPNDPEQLRQILAMHFGHASWDRPIPPQVLKLFALDQHNHMLYFPPLLHAYRYMREAIDAEEIFRIPAETVNVANVLSADERGQTTPSGP